MTETTPLPIAVLQRLGRMYGHQLDRKSVTDILATIRASFATQEAVLAAMSLVPIVGTFMAVSVGYALVDARRSTRTRALALTTP